MRLNFLLKVSQNIVRIQPLKTWQSSNNLFYFNLTKRIVGKITNQAEILIVLIFSENVVCISTRYTIQFSW